MIERFRRLGRGAAIATAAAVVAAGLLAFTPPPTASAADVPSAPAPSLQRNDDVVTADPLPAPQIDNGYIWAQAAVGNTVYAVGSFQNVRPPLTAPGTNLIPRSNILAFNITTGDLLPFAPVVNGTIRSVSASPDGSRLYIGGSFNSVNGQARWNFAALDAATGQLISSFAPAVGGTSVNGIAVTADKVYIAGLFTQANGIARQNFAAFSASNGSLLSWAPTSDLQADALVVEPGGAHIVAAGRFSQVNGATQRGLVGLDPASGAIDTSWAAPKTVINGAGPGSNYAGMAGIFSLNTDATSVYGTGWSYAPYSVGNLEGAFAADAGSGAIRWVSDCHGDHYGVYSTGKTVYTTSHTHACETVGLAPEQPNRQYRYFEAYTVDARGTLPTSQTASSTYMDWKGTPSPSAYIVAPDFTVGTTSGLGQAGLSITGAGDFISVAGEFTSVNNQQYQGIVRFSTNPPTGKKQAPRLSGTSWGTPNGQSVVPGRVRVTIPTNWDRDDRNLVYDLLRDGDTAPVATTTVPSFWWERTPVILTDPSAQPGSTQTYRVRVTDSDGNSQTSSPVAVQVNAGTPMPYAGAVLDDGASLYYPLGSIKQDWGGSNTPSFGSSVSTVTPGALSGSDASNFSGTSSGWVSGNSQLSGPTQFSQELWFKTSTKNGGKLIGFGSSRTGQSSSYDRHIYMQTNGRLTFGVYPGSTKTVTSSQAYNDNQWHQVVTTMGPEGLVMYVDGAQVASDPSTTSAQSYSGYWRIGGDSLGSWPSAPSNVWFKGAIDEVAIYPTVLRADQVAAHYALGTGVELPTAAMTATPTDLSVTFDGSGSTTPSGTITGYSWNFGDGSAASTSAAPTHEYATPGKYDVILTVTDSRGLSASTTQTVTVVAPNAPPTASFTSSADGLSVSADGSASADSDGSIAGYSWDWGDGSAPGTGVTAGHKYSQAGDYVVTLTVTDDRGAAVSTTRTVTATHAAPVAAFDLAASGLTVSADASSSSGSDDAMLSYSWNWGDGSAADSGVGRTHTYAQAGAYTVTLTVTDSYGAHTTATRDVTVAKVLYAASDDFERTVASGWGSADVGGAWTALYSPASLASVSGGKGVMSLAPGNTMNMALRGVSVTDTRTEASFSLSSAPATGSNYVGVVARQSASADYTVRAWMRNDSTVWLVTQRSGAVLDARQVPGVTWSAGDDMQLKVEVSGTNPTTIKSRLWKSGTTEPGTWQATVTDSTAALQQAGYGGVHAARTGSATSPTNVTFDGFRVTDLSKPEILPPTAEFTAKAKYLGVDVDGSASHASSGSITDYQWDWGDGSAASHGATASHTYAQPGSYTVALTVTDEYQLTRKVTHSVTVAENKAPTASFTAPGTGMSAKVDASGSTDPEGAPLTYAWNWGDGTPDASGATATHRYATPGTYTVTLTVTDEGGLTDSTTRTVEAVDVPPTAAFTAVSTALRVSVDGGASSDGDGPIAAYSWDWGDGSTPGTGATAVHTYAAAGTYHITLQVTDGGGQTATVTHDITMTPFLAADAFERTVGSGWGTADTGGAWAVRYGAASSTSVSGGAGKVALNPSDTRNMILTGTSFKDVTVSTVFSLNAAPAQGSAYAGIVVRDNGTDNYMVRVWLRNDGSVWLVPQHGSTVLGTYIVPGITRAAGDAFSLKVSLTGADTGTTKISAKLWRTGATEPANWQIAVQDSTAALQAALPVGLHANSSGAATGPAVITFDDFQVLPG
ncbi:PKD domain-containing protein [Microbacterium sp.]|uniref:PKD domain-containing protein n=1 Tax=Microbacterium sp. TaxID=51671 RepID=UPI003C76BFA0